MGAPAIPPAPWLFMGACAPSLPARPYDYYEIDDEPIDLDEFGQEIDEPRNPRWLTIGIAIIAAFALGMFAAQWIS